jgi:nucleotide sugar dehydrogenase
MIYLKSEDEIRESIKNREINICVIGLGTIGLPVAIHFANVGFKVNGLETNKDKVKKINRGTYPVEYPRIFKKVIKEKKLVATNDPKGAMKDTDVAIICVPTPLTRERDIDLRFIELAVDNIAEYMKPGLVFIIESAVTPGITREMAKRIEKNTNYKLGKDFGAVACPERYNPGLPSEVHGTVVYKKVNKHVDSVYTLDQINRVIGGIDHKSSLIAKELYSAFVKGKITIVSSPEVAESTKLLENIFRDVNIALINELSKIFTKFGLDSYEIIEAAKTKPFAFVPHYPGPGVGGECIPVDTWYLIKKAEKLGCATDIMRTARAVNDSLPAYVVDLTRKALHERGRKLKGSKICVLGIAYKKNIADTRLSPAFSIIELLNKEGANVCACDPLVDENSTRQNVKLKKIDDAFEGRDAIIMVTDHDVFKKIDLFEIKKSMRDYVIIDCRNFFDENEVISLGFTYKGIGKRE